MLERLPTGVLVFDEALIVVYANLALRRVLHPVQPRVGGSISSIGSTPPLDELARRLFHRRAAAVEEVELDGRTFTVQGALDKSGMYGTLVIDDISARRRRARSEEDFVVNASHEILGPVAAIAGAAQVLKDGAKDDPVARERFIAHIAEAADRLTSTAVALLTLAKAEAGLGGPRLELVPVRPVLEEISRGKGDVTVDCGASVGVLADEDLFRQTVTNLVENARRHSRDGVGITVEEAGQMVAVDVLDRGGGILPENLERVTERFYSSEGQAGRYGIGLSIAARAARALGGTLDLASNRSGTRARLCLPSAKLL